MPGLLFWNVSPRIELPWLGCPWPGGWGLLPVLDCVLPPVLDCGVRHPDAATTRTSAKEIIAITIVLAIASLRYYPA